MATVQDLKRRIRSVRNTRKITKAMELVASARLRRAQALAHRLIELYTEEEIDRAVVIYNHFESPLVQRVVQQDVLPVPEQLLEGGREEEERREALLGD